MQSFTNWLSQLNFGYIWDYVVIVAASLVCIMFHEVSHGVTALKLGDPTAKNAGRLTFNPMRHVDVWGLLMMAIFRFGWAKCPSTCGTSGIRSVIWPSPPRQDPSPTWFWPFWLCASGRGRFM